MDTVFDGVIDTLARTGRRPVFRVGDLVWYIVAEAGAPRLTYAAAVIVRRGKAGRLGIETVLDRRVRYVTPYRLSRLPPPANVNVYWSEQCRPPLCPIADGDESIRVDRPE